MNMHVQIALQSYVAIRRKLCFVLALTMKRAGTSVRHGLVHGLLFKPRTITYSSQSKFSEGKWLPGERGSLASPRAIALRDRRQSRSYQDNCLWKWPRGRAWSKNPHRSIRGYRWRGLTSSVVISERFFFFPGQWFWFKCSLRRGTNADSQPPVEAGADFGWSWGWCAADMFISPSLGLTPSLPDPTGLSALTLVVVIFYTTDT